MREERCSGRYKRHRKTRNSSGERTKSLSGISRERDHRRRVKGEAKILDGICISVLGSPVGGGELRSSWKGLVWKDDDLGFGAADFEVHVW